MVVKATRKLYDLGQSFWLDKITGGMLRDGTLLRYIHELSVTGLTSDPAIFLHAMEKGDLYDEAIRRRTADGLSGEKMFYELAREYMRQADCFFRPVHHASSGLDAWASLELSPALANDIAGSVRRPSNSNARRSAPTAHHDSGNAGRRAGHRGVDLPRGADQRHAALLERASFGCMTIATTPCRDSLSCNLMEALRPSVDRSLMQLLATKTFLRSDFFEAREGVCRFMPS